MKRILVPTDFSDTSKNAARYAVTMAAENPGSVIVLYNVYDTNAAGSDGSLLTETEQDRKIVLGQALAQLAIELHEISAVKIECVAESGRALVENVDKYVGHTGVDLVVMGITGSSALEQIFVGSNALNVAREIECPVMIVPDAAQFQNGARVMLLSDFKDVKEVTPVAQIKKVLEIVGSELHIVNVDTVSHMELQQEYQTDESWLKENFAAYNPKVHFLRSPDFVEGINRFVSENRIDLIVTVPKRHSFFDGLFNKDHTKRLAYHSHVPVITVSA